MTYLCIVSLMQVSLGSFIKICQKSDTALKGTVSPDLTNYLKVQDLQCVVFSLTCDGFKLFNTLLFFNSKVKL